LGAGFASLYAGSGSDSIVDYQILNFQLGVGGDVDNYGTSTSKLIEPLSSTQYTSDGSQLHIDDTHKLLVSSNVLTDTVKLVRIPYSNIHKITPTSIRYTLVVDSNSCNNLTNITGGGKLYLSEIGLFMRNPLNLSPPASILVAYRPFTGIYKTSAFALVFKWTLKF
jgi:hypothetical protein